MVEERRIGADVAQAVGVRARDGREFVLVPGLQGTGRFNNRVVRAEDLDTVELWIGQPVRRGGSLIAVWMGPDDRGVRILLPDLRERHASRGDRPLGPVDQRVPKAARFDFLSGQNVKCVREARRTGSTAVTWLQDECSDVWLCISAIIELPV